LAGLFNLNLADELFYFPGVLLKQYKRGANAPLLYYFPLPLQRRVEERLRLSYINTSPSPSQGEGDTGGEVDRQRQMNGIE
jgi:hypothetical protein